MTTNRKVEVRIHNVGPHADLTLQFAPGVNVLQGRNGAGKSTAISATAAGLGGKEKVTIKDGAVAGSVTVDGVVVLQIGKSLTPKGQPSVELGSYAPIGEVIDGGGLADPVKADARRVKAVLALSPVPVTDEVKALLAGNHPKLTQAAIPPEFQANVLGVAEFYRRTANHLALEEEKRAAGESAAAAAESLRLGAHSASGAVPARSQAELAVRAAHERLAGLKIQFRAKAEAEARNARLKAVVDAGEPQLNMAKAATAAAEDTFRRARDAYNDAQAAAKLAQAEANAAMEAMDMVRENEAKVEAAHATWRQAKSILDENVSGPDAIEVSAAESAVQAAQATLQTSIAAEEAKTLQDSIGRHMVESEDAAKQAKAFREIAQGIGGRLGEVLKANGIAALDMEDGRLFAVVNEKRQLFADRLSFGQKARIALDIALQAFEGRFIPVDPAFWHALQPSAQTELAALAEQLDVILVTEQPTDEDFITVTRRPL